MKQSDIIRWYSRPEIAAAIVESAENKEVAIQLNSGAFGKRPNILQFPGDVNELTRKGATSFHISVENWSDPLLLGPESTDQMLTELRIGWDLIIDIDCPWFEYSKKTARLIIEYLKGQGVKNIGIKFSGNKGWHLSVPFESFPKTILRGKYETGKAFPLLLEKFLIKLKSELNDYLNNSNKTYFEKTLDDLFSKCGEDKNKIVVNGKVDFLKLMDIDLAMASPRHLIRSPYSLHEKSGLVSMVIEESELDSFEKEFAEPEKIKEIKKFFKRDSSEEGDSKNLFSGLDFTEKSGYVGSKRSFETIKIKLNKELFPPCMKRISEGLDDGRKRALFSLVNFYKKFDIEWETLEIEIYAWNEKNRPALKKGYIKAQLDWHRRQSKRIPPPNCKDYYKEIGVCFPDNICQKIRNPLTYVTIKTNPQRRKKKK